MSGTRWRRCDAAAEATDRQTMDFAERTWRGEGITAGAVEWWSGGERGGEAAVKCGHVRFEPMPPWLRVGGGG